jgi:hypothetical protein
MKVIRDEEPSAPVVLVEPAPPRQTYWNRPDAWWNNPDPALWWNHESFPYSAPWWFRYPLGVAAGVGAWYCLVEWESHKLARWLFGILLVFIVLGLVRELFLGLLLAVVVGGGLWAVGAAVAALPVSVAIIIGAMIIAARMRN